jgi:hypothetical protein
MSSKLASALETLDRAKERKVPWTEVAQIVSQGMEAEPGATGSRAFLAKATERTGYSSNMLLRFVSVWKFLNAELVPRRPSIAEARDIRFSGLEHIQRAWKVNQQAAEDLLNRVLDRRITVRELQQAVAKLRIGSPRYERFVIRSFGQRVEALVIDEMRKDTRTFFGSDAAEIRAGIRLPFWLGLLPDAIVPIQQDKQIIAVDGIDINIPSHEPPSMFTKQWISRWGWSSTFFRRFWLVLVDPWEAIEKTVPEVITKLSLDNIGIAIATIGQRKIRVAKQPVETVPVPDRRPRVLYAIEKGIEQYGQSFWQRSQPRMVIVR